MKIPIIAISLIACSLSYAATENEGVEKLKLELKNAVEKKSIESVDSLYEWGDVLFVIRDQELSFWRDFRFKDLMKDSKVSDIEWVPIEDFSKEQRDNLEPRIKGSKINGNTYISNVPILGILKLNFLHEKGGGGSMTFPVGKNASGKYILVSTVIHREDIQKNNK